MPILINMINFYVQSPIGTHTNHPEFGDSDKQQEKFLLFMMV